ncbi:MAG: hypothetical protein IT384_02735 [Deltaproteobacteria bacterium]|nr:hypothetical protein [Deltaproteobacteria bacterium]
MLIPNITTQDDPGTMVLRRHYPALIDHQSSSRNFETSGKKAYLYFTEYQQVGTLNRDLRRVPVEFP